MTGFDPAEARRLADAATPGPWLTWLDNGEDWADVMHGNDSVLHGYFQGQCDGCDEVIVAEASVAISVEDLKFIAYMGTHRAEILDRLDAATRDRDAIDVAHVERQREFSRRTFGPGPRTEGVLAHITKELDEIRDAPDDLTEWADAILLAFDGAWRTGAEPAKIIAAVKAKQAVNEAREWPDWRTADPDAPIEHVRGSGATPQQTEHVVCDCVPTLGPPHCHRCSEIAGREVSWAEAHPKEVSDA